jgi:hypothetical protein
MALLKIFKELTIIMRGDGTRNKSMKMALKEEQAKHFLLRENSFKNLYFKIVEQY